MRSRTIKRRNSRNRSFRKTKTFKRRVSRRTISKKSRKLRGGRIRSRSISKKSRKLSGGATFTKAQLSALETKIVFDGGIHPNLKNLLGKGEFGKVYLGTLDREEKDEEDQVVAIKTIERGVDEEQKKEVLDEAILMAELIHPNIVNLLAVSGFKVKYENRTYTVDFTDGVTPLICLEYCAKGDLLNFIRKTNNLPEITLLNFMINVANGEQYLISKSIVHRDLAARNVLICVCDASSDENNCTAKIADFGMSKKMKANTWTATTPGKIPIKWTSIEILTVSKVYSEKSEVWAFGIVLWETMSLGKIPYKGKNNTEAVISIMDGERLLKPVHCSEDIYTLMTNCWKATPEDRPTFDEIVTQLTAIRDATMKDARTITRQQQVLEQVTDEEDYQKMIHTKFIAEELQKLNHYFSNPKIDDGRERDELVDLVDITLTQELPYPIPPGFIFNLVVDIIYGDTNGESHIKIKSHLQTINLLFMYLYINDQTFSKFVEENTVNSFLTMTLDKLFKYLVESNISIPKENIIDGTVKYNFKKDDGDPDYDQPLKPLKPLTTYEDPDNRN